MCGATTNLIRTINENPKLSIGIWRNIKVKEGKDRVEQTGCLLNINRCLINTSRILYLPRHQVPHVLPSILWTDCTIYLPCLHPLPTTISTERILCLPEEGGVQGQTEVSFGEKCPRHRLPTSFCGFRLLSLIWCWVIRNFRRDAAHLFHRSPCGDAFILAAVGHEEGRSSSPIRSRRKRLASAHHGRRLGFPVEIRRTDDCAVHLLGAVTGMLERGR